MTPETEPSRVVLYVEVDDVPWRQTEGAWTVAGVFRLLEDARLLGLVFSVYATPRTLAAFPALADFIAGEGQRLLTAPQTAFSTSWPTEPGTGTWWLRLKPNAEAKAVRKKLDRISRKGWSLT